MRPSNVVYTYAHYIHFNLLTKNNQIKIWKSGIVLFLKEHV